jgi:Tfp pilus assembly protein PilV
MKQHRQSGLSLIEVLVSLTMITVALSGIITAQVGNLRVTSNAKMRTDLKAESVRVIERVTAIVLKGNNTAGSSTKPLFNDYYAVCGPSGAVLPSGLRITRDACQGTLERSQYVIQSGVTDTPGDTYQSEGLLTITVTTTVNGSSFTLGNRISCYDIYPTPTVDTPDACGNVGGGS